MKIEVGPYHLNIRQPYAQGQHMTSAQAKALNDLRASRLRELMVKEYKKTLKLYGRTEILQDNQLQEFSDRMLKLDSDWEFPSPTEMFVPKDPLIKPGSLAWELKEMAKELVELEARRLGLQLTAEEFFEAVKERERDYAVTQLATERYMARREANKNMLRELFE